MGIKCPLCNYVANTIDELVGHLLTAHKDEEIKEEKTRLFECKFCGEVFKTEEEILQHLCQHHRKELEEAGIDVNELCGEEHKEEEQPKRKRKRKRSSQPLK